MNQIEQMTPAQQTVFFEVYLPTFLRKTAEAGLPLNDAESINDALETTALLHMTMDSQNQSVVKQASQSLKRVLGIDQVQAVAQKQQDAVTKAAQAVLDPQLKAAILEA